LNTTNHFGRCCFVFCFLAPGSRRADPLRWCVVPMPMGFLISPLRFVWSADASLPPWLGKMPTWFRVTAGLVRFFSRAHPGLIWRPPWTGPSFFSCDWPEPRRFRWKLRFPFPRKKPVGFFFHWIGGQLLLPCELRLYGMNMRCMIGRKW